MDAPDLEERERARKALADHERFMAEPKTFHLPVVNLTLPRACEVGRVTFRPAAALDALINVAIEAKRESAEAMRRRETESWATADVTAVTLEEARERAGDAVAVLRLYQRTRYPYVSLDHQTFGLTPDVDYALEEYWTSRDGQITGSGYRAHGILSDWTFQEQDIVAFAASPVFAPLSQVLRSDESALDDLQLRLLTSLRIANQATRMLAPAIRAVLFAVAMESLLGQPEGQRAREGNRAHRVSVRYAYLTCDLKTDGSGLHGPSRPACLYLAALHENQDWLVARLRDHFPQGGGACSAYLDCDELMQRRNALLHEGLKWKGPRRPESLEGRFDRAFLGLERWRQKTGATRLAEIDAEIDELCAMNPALITLGRRGS